MPNLFFYHSTQITQKDNENFKSVLKTLKDKAQETIIDPLL